MSDATDEGETLKVAACHAHASVPAIATCRGCFRPLCETCAINDSHLVPRCADCTRRRSRQNTVAGVALVALIGGLVTAGVRYYRQLQREEALAEAAKAALPDYGIAADHIKALSARVDREPCDRDAILKLGEALMRAGDARGALKRSSAFMAKCGDYPRLRWVTYAAHKQLSEWDGAVTEATKLIEFDPYDPDYRGWRGLMYERKGDLAHAVQDYQQALILRPRLADLRLNLADALEKLGRPCEAILPLAQAAFYYPDATNVQSLHVRVAELSASAQCAWAAGEGQAQIKMSHGDVMEVDVRINDREVGRFIIDTGATLVVLSRDFANRLGISTKGAPTVLADTANGVTSSAIVSLDKVELRGIRAARVVGAVAERLTNIDGLLGMSFLSRFDLEQKGGTFEIKARKR